MNLPLIFRFFFFLLNLSSQDLQELWFQQHLFNSNEYFQYKFDDLTDGKLETDTIGDDDLIIDNLISIDRYDILELSIDFFELFANELFKQKNLSVFIDVKKSIYVCSH